MSRPSSLRVHFARIKKAVIKDTYFLIDQLMDTDKLIRYRHQLNGYDNPDYRFRKDQIGFIHIPKTAGTTLANMLDQDSGDAFVNLHIHRPISAHCPPSEYQYLTILREPVSRVWSHYQMVLREVPGYPYQKYARKGLETFLKKYWAVRNFTCRYFTGEIYTEPDAATLAQALENLANFQKVILFEHFSESARDLLVQHGIPFKQVLHSRKSAYQAPSALEKEMIARYNEFDIALYNTWRANSNP
jgi:hypothetical protein